MDMIARLRAERQSLVGRLEEIDKILLQYDEIEQAAQRLLGAALATDSQQQKAGTVAEVEIPDRDSPSDRVLSGKNKTPTEIFQQAVIDVLKDANSPMDRVELYDALTDRGIVLGSGDRDKDLNVLSARVYRMAQAGQLVGGRGQGYSLKEDALPDEDSHGGEENSPQDLSANEDRHVDNDILID